MGRGLIRILSLFQERAEPPRNRKAEDLISLLRIESDPALIDAAMLAASHNQPFWPAEPEIIRFLEEAKKTPLQDAQMIAAAAFSAEERIQALETHRRAARDTAYIHFIAPDHDNYFQSRVFKMASPLRNGGHHGFGGLRCPSDASLDATLDRHIAHHVASQLHIMLAAHSAQEAGRAFTAAQSQAALMERGYDAVFEDITALFADRPALQREVADFCARCRTLTQELTAAPRHRLFTAHDDNHVIARGWGDCTDAHYAVGEISEQTAKNLLAFIADVEMFKQQNSLPPDARQPMAQIESYTFMDAPDLVARALDAGQGFAEITGFGRLLYPQLGNRGLRHFFDDCMESGAVQMFAGKMRLRVEHLQKIFDGRAREEDARAFVIPASLYAEARRVSENDEHDATRDLSPPRSVYSY